MAALTYKSVLELFAETDKRLEKASKELDKRFEKVSKELDKRFAQINKQIADLGDTLGRFAEEQVRADLIDKFAKWGIAVHSMANHFVQRDKKNEYAYEVDILIYNAKYVVAIGVKNTLKKDDVDEHLDRMKKMQALPLPDTKGKILLSAVAGMIVGEGVDRYAESKGLS